MGFSISYGFGFGKFQSWVIALRVENEIRRGISPRTLLTQIDNTAAFLFDASEYPHFQSLPYVQIVNDARNRVSAFSGPPAATAAKEQELFSHADYFRLCLAAHWCTVATFVPTDVDNQIRLKLWNSQLPTETLTQMANQVCESLSWNPEPVTTRWVRSPRTQELMCGHHGEWFSTAVAAYAALHRKDPSRSESVLTMILMEMEREKQIFEDLSAARDGAGILKASTIIAHNLGDLDRVIDLWNLSNEDPLRIQAYEAGHRPLPQLGKTLYLAGEINKKHMAHENHRHLPLRAPRCLRRKPEYLLPVGPFFDEWGQKIARDRSLSLEEIAQVAESLVSGWEKLDHPVGYARALNGLIESFPGQLGELTKYLPAKVARTLKSGDLRSQCSISKERFEQQWNQYGLTARNLVR